MTQEQIEKVNGMANKLAKELWRSEHLECFGNLEIKLQEIVKNLTIPVVSNSFCDCEIKEPCTFTEHGKIVEKCINCGNPIANDC
jgi:hypothetical protein